TVPHRNVTTNEVYDPATDKWETRMPMSVPRNHLAGAAVNGKIYAIGGRVGSPFVGASSPDILEAHDPARDRWYELPPMTTPRHGFAGGVINGVFYTATGQLQSGTGGGGPG